MKLRKFILSALLLVIGLILHYATPPILMGMKPDFLLAMMFIAIIIVDDYKTALVIGIASGLLTAATTTFPGGQVANIIDKLVTSHIIFLINGLLNRMNIRDNYKMIIISITGTLISGIVFLTSAMLIVGLPGSFGTLVLTVVLPATVINTVAAFILYKAVSVGLKYSKFI